MRLCIHSFLLFDIPIEFLSFLRFSFFNRQTFPSPTDPSPFPLTVLRNQFSSNQVTLASSAGSLRRSTTVQHTCPYKNNVQTHESRVELRMFNCSDRGRFLPLLVSLATLRLGGFPRRRHLAFNRFINRGWRLISEEENGRVGGRLAA